MKWVLRLLVGLSLGFLVALAVHVWREAFIRPYGPGTFAPHEFEDRFHEWEKTHVDGD